MAIQQATLGQVSQFLTVNWEWTCSVTPAASVVMSKTWPANPNSAPDYLAGPYNATGTVTASLNEPRSLPANANIIGETGPKPPEKISISLDAQFKSSNSSEAVIRYATKLNAANGVPFLLGNGQSYGYTASGSVYFIKPPGGNTQPYTSTSTISLSLSLAPQSVMKGSYTIEYQTVPEPEAVAVLAGLPLVAWGMLRRLRTPATS